MLPYLRMRNFRDLKDKADFVSNFFEEMFYIENDNILTFENVSGDTFEYNCENHILLVNGKNIGNVKPSLKIKYKYQKIKKKGKQEEKINIDLCFYSL